MVLNVKETRSMPNRFVSFSLCFLSIGELLGALHDMSVKCRFCFLYCYTMFDMGLSSAGAHRAFQDFLSRGWPMCSLQLNSIACISAVIT